MSPGSRLSAHRPAEKCDEALECISGFTEAETFDSWCCSFTDRGLAYLGRLRKLRRVQIQSPEITDDGLKALKGLDGLESLSVDAPKVLGPGLKNLEGLRHLEALDVTNTGVDKDGSKYLTGMTSLKAICLGDGISSESLRSIEGLSRLECLYVGRELDSTCVKHLAALKNLQKIPTIRGVNDAELVQIAGLPCSAGCRYPPARPVKGDTASWPRSGDWRGSTCPKPASTPRRLNT